jgi:formiminoglutamase
MDLSLFFHPVEESLIESITDVNAFGKCIRHNQGIISELSSLDVALIGITEHRGVSGAEGVVGAPEHIRKKLYKLKKGTGNYERIMDLGDLKNGEVFTDTYDRLKEVCFMLLDANVLPVLIGGTHDLDLGQYRGYDGLDKLITVLNIDARLDIAEPETGKANTHNTQQIFLNEPNFLFNYIHLAYQSYLIEPTAIHVLDRLFFESYRLGQIRENFKNIEPIVRDADMLTFDLSAIRSADAGATGNSIPFGLTGEEACQISWYAGLNDKLSSAGFYEYDPGKDDASGSTAFVVATMVWYFLEGFCHRKFDHHLKVNDYTRYVVSMPSEKESVVFYKSTKSERWWMEVPHPKQASYNRNRIVPCSYTDYLTATQGELPERWLSTYNRLL